MGIRRKRLPERLRLDGRSLALLFLVGVFSVNFYLSSIRTAPGAEQPPEPQPIFSVTSKDVALPHQVAVLRSNVGQLVLKNPYGKIEVVGTDKRDLVIEAVAHVQTSGDEDPLYEALRYTPIVEFGDTMTVSVPNLRTADDPKASAYETVDLTVQVPAHLELLIRTERGEVNVNSYQGNLSVSAKAGNVNVDKLGGSLKVENLNGAISAKNIKGNATLSTLQGGVTALDVKGDVQIKSESGGCVVRTIGGKLDLTANLGKVEIEGIAGDAVVNSTSGLLKVKDAHRELHTTVKNGDISVSGAVKGAWTVSTANGRVDMNIAKTSGFRFLGETSKGVIKGPTKQSPSGGTKPGAYITEQVGDGKFPVTVRSDNGGIFVEMN
ncbi:MAG: DUF4097 family beta strand repeat-containing protein [Tumebacillaceae bacterium]